MANFIHTGRLIFAENNITDTFDIYQISYSNNTIYAHYKDSNNNQIRLPLTSGYILDKSSISNMVMIGFQNSSKIILTTKGTSVTLPSYSDLGYATTSTKTSHGFNSKIDNSGTHYDESSTSSFTSSVMLYPIYKFTDSNITGSVTSITAENETENNGWKDSNKTNLQGSHYWHVTKVTWNYACDYDLNSDYLGGAVLLFNGNTRIDNEDLQQFYSRSSGTSTFSRLNYYSNSYILSAGAKKVSGDHYKTKLTSLVISGYRYGNS